MEKETPLSHDQQVRVEALLQARNVLATKTGFTSAAVDPVDLHNIAQYIVTGQDPWSDIRPSGGWYYRDVEEEKSDG